MKIKKSEIEIDGVVYILIKSEDEIGKKRCEHFIKYKTGEPICWKHGSELGTANWIEFFLNGKRHREDGPAVIWTSTKNGQNWGINGQELSNQDDRGAWYINGQLLSPEEEQNQIRKINLNKCL